MALSQLLAMYPKPAVQLLNILKIRCQCQDNVVKVATLARLKDAEDRLWKLNRQHKCLRRNRDLRKILDAHYEIRNRGNNTCWNNYQQTHILSITKPFTHIPCVTSHFIHSSSGACKDDEKSGDSSKPKKLDDSSKPKKSDDSSKSEKSSDSSKPEDETSQECSVAHQENADSSKDKEKVTSDSEAVKVMDGQSQPDYANFLDESESTDNGKKNHIEKNEVKDSQSNINREIVQRLNEDHSEHDGVVSSPSLPSSKKGTASLQRDPRGGIAEKILDPQNYMLQRGFLKFVSENDLPYKESYTGYYIVCPKFGKVAMKRKKEEHQIYINHLSGYFKCNACGKTGNWNQLKDNITYVLLSKGRKKAQMECFKDIIELESAEEQKEEMDQVQEVLDKAKDLWRVEADEFENILSLFDWQGITKQTFKRYGVKYVHKDNKYMVYFPIVAPNKTLTGTRVYTAVITEEEDVKLETVYTIPRTRDSDMFGWQTRPEPDTKNFYRRLVITTGEVQAMAVSQQTTFTTLSIKTIDNFAQEHVPNLEKFEKIYLWLGTDIKAWEISKLVAKKLNEKRCLIFRPANVDEMPLECIHTDQDLAKKLRMARPLSHEAIHMFHHLRLDVYREFSHHEHVTGVKWKRYFKLNDILKGFRQGELTVLTGPTGCGKTTFLSEYSLDLCMQGVNTMWGSFEISNVRLIKVMMQQFSRLNLTKNLDQFERVSKEFTVLPMYFMAYHGAQNVNTVLETMCHAVYVHGIQHVILDNLQFMVGLENLNDSMPNIFLRQDRIVSQFRKFATENNCHVTLIIHPRKVDKGEELSISSIFGSAKVSQEADNIYLIQDNRLTKPGGRKYLQITKNRFDGDLGVMTLTFDKESLSFTMNQKNRPTPLPEL